MARRFSYLLTNLNNNLGFNINYFNNKAFSRLFWFLAHILQIICRYKDLIIQLYPLQTGFIFLTHAQLVNVINELTYYFTNVSIQYCCIKMAYVIEPEVVKYACTCGTLKLISRLYLCRHCMELRCAYCVCHEVKYYFIIIIIIPINSTLLTF